MSKTKKKHTSENQKIADVKKRLELFIEICENDMKLLNLSYSEKNEFWGQISAFGICLTLLEQTERRGEIWKGGYLDNIGVVYSDQVMEYLEQQKRQLNG